MSEAGSCALGVLYVIDELWQLGGAERNLVRILRRLPRDRFCPVVLTFRFNPEVAEFQQIPCPVEVYPVRRIYGWAAVRYIPKLLRLLRERRIRIVHAFYESSDLWAGLIAKLTSRAVLISSRRDLGIQRNRALDAAYRLIGPLVDQVQAVSEAVREYVIRADRLDPSKVITVPNGIDLEQVRPRVTAAAVRERYGLGGAGPLVITVANIRRVKGLDVLVRSAEIVRRRIPGVRFLVAGRVLEHDFLAELESSIREGGLQETVRLLGPVEDLFSLLPVCDAFFLPSRSEGMSNALLEAMACELPAVATRVGGNTELVQDGRTGFLTPPEDHEAAAARLIDLLNDPVGARQMGEAARGLVAERYSMDAVMRLLVSQYERLASEERPGGSTAASSFA